MTNLQTLDVDKILTVARKAAEVHGWCSEVDDVLREAGLLPEMKRLMATVTLEVKLPVFDGKTESEVQEYIDSLEWCASDENSTEVVCLYGRELQGVQTTTIAEASKEDAYEWLVTSSRGSLQHAYEIGSHYALCSVWGNPNSRLSNIAKDHCPKCQAKFDNL